MVRDRRTIFYSWQSDSRASMNRTFIETALETAVRELKESLEIEPVVDRDTRGVPGAPNIAATILAKIDRAAVIVADVSIINPRDGGPMTWTDRLLGAVGLRRIALAARDGGGRLSPNPNVLFELGYAVRRHGWDRVILVLNSASGRIEDLPFDLRGHRPVVYASREGDTDRATERKRLAKNLKRAIATILEIPEVPEPAPAVDERLGAITDISAFADAVFDVFEADQPQRLRGILADVPPRVRALLDKEEMADASFSEVTLLLDRVTAVTFGAVRYRRSDILEYCVEIFVRVYESCFTDAGDPWYRGPARPPHRLWIEVASRLMAAGAYTVEEQAWDEARVVALASLNDSYRRGNGIRTTLYRHTAYNAWERGGRSRSGRDDDCCRHFVEEVTRTVESLSWAHAHLGESSRRRADAVGRFDCLSYLVASLEWEDEMIPPAFACFIHFGAHATDGFLVRLLGDGAMQRRLFGDSWDEERLAQTLRAALRYASGVTNMGFLWPSRSVIHFLEQHKVATGRS